MRIMISTDSPFIPSGQARVGRELAIGLAKRGHELGYLGWFHRQDIFPNLPYNIQFWWTNNTAYGADVLDGVIQRFMPDVLLTIGDFWNISYITNPQICRTRKLFQWCAYCPVDGEPEGGGLPPSIIPVMADVDIPVAYTEYAKQAILKSVMDQETRSRIKVIYHGVDTSIFKPDTQKRIELREKLEIQDKFVFLTVSRNQSRKNIPIIFKAWKIFSNLPETIGKVILWPHMFFNDSMGWQIDDLFEILGLKDHSVMFYRHVAYAQSEQHLIKDSDLADLYRLSDAFILLSGEGFGLPIFEAMATRLPCILIDHSASSELGAEGRAELVPLSGTMTWTGMHLTERPLVSVDNVVASMLKIFREKQYRESVSQKGYDYATKFTWEKVVDEWHMLFSSYEIPFIKPMRMEVVT